MTGRTKQIEKQIGKYLVKKEIAHGGMGVVYEALHPELNKSVIIKELTIHKKEIAERFKREAQILMDMQSQYIVNTYDYFQEGKSRYIVEELVDGLSLNNLILHHGKLPCNIAMIIFLNVCNALKFAHSKNIIHRDIKPANILLSKRAEVKLADFGIAGNEKEKHPEPLDSMATTKKVEDTGLTQAKSAMGTPAYMAPEQFTDSSSVDKTADIYSLGIMLYEMLTGKRPFNGGSSMKETYDERVQHKHVPLGLLYKEKIPLRIYLMIRKMTMTKKEKRYQSVDPIIRIVMSYLKLYNHKELLTQISRMVRHYSAGNVTHYELRPILAKRNTAMWVSISISALMIFSWLFFTAIRERFFYHLSPFHKNVSVNMQLPFTESEAADLPATVYFYKKDNSAEVKGMRSGFIVENISDKEKNLRYKYLKSGNIWLRPGKYKAKIAIGQYVIWRSLDVDKKKGGTLNFNYLNMQQRPLKIAVSAYDVILDENTGSYINRDITKNVNVSVFYGGWWQPLSSVRNKLTTDEEWKVKFSAKGYKDEIFTTKVDWFQDELHIYVQMQQP